MNQYRCRFDYFNNKSKPMCYNWDCFFNSCKLTWYETTLEGKKQTIHPNLSTEKLWIIEQVGCASHSDFQNCQTGYIITEEQLEIFERNAGNLSNLASKVRSHPYQSERGKCAASATFKRQSDCEDKIPSKEVCKDCHYFQSERDKVLDGRKLYQCNSDTCSDSGGVCILCIPDMDFSPPTSCVNPEAFTDNGDEPDCKWEELRYQAGERE
jgi:hypothetical protein